MRLDYHSTLEIKRYKSCVHFKHNHLIKLFIYCVVFKKNGLLCRVNKQVKGGYFILYIKYNIKHTNSGNNCHRHNSYSEILRIISIIVCI